jgi:flagellar hook-associated protein 3 FlgL
MRVTSNLFPATLKSQLAALQQEQQRLQSQIATGLRFTQASQDPAAFAAAQRLGELQSHAQAHLVATRSAQDQEKHNHAALADLQRLFSRARELTIRAGGILGPGEIRAVGQEFSSLVDQVASVINRERLGVPLFGGTGARPPIGIVSPGSPPVYGYDASAAYTAQVSRADIAENTTVDTGFVAGRPGAGGFDGILVSGTEDALAALQSIRDQMLAGVPVDTTSAQARLLDKSGERISEYVGRAAARLSVLTLNEQHLRGLVQGGAERLAEHTQVSVTDAVTDLQRVQFHYQAAMQSGASILNLSLMNYLRGV